MSKIFNNGTRKDTTPAKKTGLGISLARPVQSRNYAFAKEGVVPAGKYTSTIVEINRSKTKSGAEAVDILMDLRNAADRVFHILMRYPRDSAHFAELVGALLAAGLSETDDIIAAVGIRERVVLEYINDSTIGSITSRSPIGRKVIAKTVTEVEEPEDDGDADDEGDEDLLGLDDDEDF